MKPISLDYENKTPQSDGFDVNSASPLHLLHSINSITGIYQSSQIEFYGGEIFINEICDRKILRPRIGFIHEETDLNECRFKRELQLNLIN